MKLLKYLLLTQAVYTFATAVWPIVDIRSFMEVTGYKTDIWLVKTVGALLIPVAACLGTYLVIRTDRRPALVLGMLTAIAFICIDFYYASHDVISDIYMADGVIEIIFLVGWIYVAVSNYHGLKDPTALN